jgi:hypothetical protein
MASSRIFITSQASSSFLHKKDSLAPDMQAFLQEMGVYSGSSKAGYLEFLERRRKIAEECLAIREDAKVRSHLTYRTSLIKNFDLYVQIAVNEGFATIVS